MDFHFLLLVRADKTVGALKLRYEFKKYSMHNMRSKLVNPEEHVLNKHNST